MSMHSWKNGERVYQFNGVNYSSMDKLEASEDYKKLEKKYGMWLIYEVNFWQKCNKCDVYREPYDVNGDPRYNYTNDINNHKTISYAKLGKYKNCNRKEK